MKKVKVLLSVVLVLVMVFALSVPAMATGNGRGQGGGLERQQVLIGFTGRPAAADLEAIRGLGGKVKHIYGIIPAVAAELPATAVDALARRKNVAYIEADAVVEALSQTTPWGITRTEAPAVWAQTAGKGVKVAVLDTGIDLAHSDLKVIGGISTIDVVDYDDRQGHGTHVAGTIAALQNSYGVVGMAPQAELYSVKVLSDSGSGTVSALVAGLDWSVKNGMQIVNMSLGTTSDSLSLRNAVNNAYAAGVLLVAAAGNSGTADGSGDNVRFPARYDSVIAVAATDNHNVRASFSSTGPAVELAAPGVSILSTLPVDRYGRASGTSMAAPHVAGAAAQIWAANPSLTNREVRQALRDGAINLGNASHYGYGVINVPASLKQAAPAEPVPAPAPAPAPEPAPEPVVELKLAAETDQAEYTRNETVVITVRGTLGEMVAAGERVRILVNRPNGRTANRFNNVTLNSDGQAVVRVSLKRNDPVGVYTVLVEGECGAVGRAEFRVR